METKRRNKCQKIYTHTSIFEFGHVSEEKKEERKNKKQKIRIHCFYFYYYDINITKFDNECEINNVH